MRKRKMGRMSVISKIDMWRRLRAVMKVVVVIVESSDAGKALFFFINIHFVDKEVFVYFLSTDYLPVNSFEIINVYGPFNLPIKDLRQIVRLW